ncbi:MAG: TolC family protein [Clostridiaceae bacterium]|nr:TolC family protein [Clostridiaceae bacterium]
MATALIRENATAIWDARENIRFAKKAYETQALRSESIDTKKTTFYNPFTKEDENYYYDATTQMQLRLAKEFIPAQLKYVWEVRQKALAVTGNAMANAADNLYIGLYSAYQNKILAEKSLELANRLFEREEVRYNNGLITALDLEGARLDVQTHENAIIKANRDYENIHRQFNRLAGLELNYRYDLVGTPWVSHNKILITEEQAVSSALKNRMEIWDLDQQIRLTLTKLTIYQHENVNKYDPKTKEDYEKALDEMEDLKLKLAEQKYSIEKEIRQAYQDLKTSYLDLEIAKLEFAKQKNQLETVSKQYHQGLVPISVVEQLENAVNQLEYAVNMSMITTLIKQDQFSRAISVGPGY